MMRKLYTVTAALAACFIGTAALAQDAVTAACKDGTSYSGAHRSGACRGHGGVASFGTPAASSPAPATAPAAAPAVPAAASPPPRTPAPSAAAPAQGGQVWVNAATKVYHCTGDRYYGKTKSGSYMSETDAKAAGDRPSHGKACS